MTRKLAWILATWVLWVPMSAAQWTESPMLSALVNQGELPPVKQRLPITPAQASLAQAGLEIGRYSDDLRLLMGRSKDIRMMVVYGYARLVGYDRNQRLKPDLLADVKVKDGRIFTLRLRRGHRWSDGHLLTSEDFRYYWEDIATNDRLAPFGPPQALLLGGEPPGFEVIDEYTVRYSWSQPNPFFLPALAAARPEIIYAPSHYLSQFHARYADEAQLDAIASAEGFRNWADMHVQRFRPYKNTNPALPSLQPWINQTYPPSQRFVFTRNPYYHRVDSNGNQLPYIDRVIVNIADGKLIPAKTGAGESDLQARHLAFSDYTFLKHSEKYGKIRVLLWDTTRGAHIALYPNLNVEDPIWRSIIRDVRFRRALSLAINRHEINQVIYFGLAHEGNDTVHRDSPLFEARFKQQWAGYDPDEANRLLDELGLSKRNDRGVRLLPDGRPMNIIVETAGEDTEQTDVLELISSTWKEVGIKLYSKPLQREVFRRRIYSGQTLVSVWSGMENGLSKADMSPQELAPTRQHQLQWPKWGQYVETGGSSGEAPDIQAAMELTELNHQWLKMIDNSAERNRIWKQMLMLRADQVFTIGLVSSVLQPVVVHNDLRNVPDNGFYSWVPGAYFGIYRPDTFWFERH